MKKHYFIQNIPARYPIHSTVLYSFLLYYFNANKILIGIFISLGFIYWIFILIVKLNQKPVDLNDFLKEIKNK